MARRESGRRATASRDPCADQQAQRGDDYHHAAGDAEVQGRACGTSIIAHAKHQADEESEAGQAGSGEDPRARSGIALTTHDHARGDARNTCRNERPDHGPLGVSE